MGMRDSREGLSAWVRPQFNPSPLYITKIPCPEETMEWQERNGVGRERMKTFWGWAGSCAQTQYSSCETDLQRTATKLITSLENYRCLQFLPDKQDQGVLRSGRYLPYQLLSPLPALYFTSQPHQALRYFLKRAFIHSLIHSTNMS